MENEKYIDVNSKCIVPFSFPLIILTNIVVEQIKFHFSLIN